MNLVRPFWPRRRLNPERPTVWFVGREDEDSPLDKIELDLLPEGLPYMVPAWWTHTWGPFTKYDAEAIVQGRRPPPHWSEARTGRHEEAVPQRAEPALSPERLESTDFRGRRITTGLLHEDRPRSRTPARLRRITLLTLDDAKHLERGEELRAFWINCDRHPSGCWARIRVTGRPKTWVTFPERVRVPVKYGLRDSFYITHETIAQRLVGREIIE